MKDVKKCLNEGLIEKIICNSKINRKLLKENCDNVMVINHLDFMNQYEIIGILYFSGMAEYIIN